MMMAESAAGKKPRGPPNRFLKAWEALHPFHISQRPPAKRTKAIVKESLSGLSSDPPSLAKAAPPRIHVNDVLVHAMTVRSLASSVISSADICDSIIFGDMEGQNAGKRVNAVVTFI